MQLFDVAARCRVRVCGSENKQCMGGMWACGRAGQDRRGVAWIGLGGGGRFLVLLTALMTGIGWVGR